MTHPAIDPVSVSRLQDRLGRTDPVPAVPAVPAVDAGAATTAGHAADHPTGSASATAKARARAVARRAALPVVVRLRHELDRAVGRELGALRAELAEVREELTRTRAEHGAAIAALQEELGAR